ncbi:DUF396-domain-containing protein [Cristinia sonorae]|uniref:DUF396-domain-containing protein n=1 Tax=Cristinia sonorae TaxID=1940300 RepID=A0A8K0UJG5_9AGAR|nr:DUF396-domain-containing protein [Cristinia sonorae]
MSLLHWLSFAGAAAAFIFVTLSLASGLLWLSEVIEENSRLAKVVGQRGIYAIILLHITLYFTDSLPFRHTLFSVVCHVVYLQNISSRWPFISLTSLSFIASCILVVIDHFIWFFHFAHVTQQARQRARTTYHSPNSIKAPGFADIATFFGVCVWLAPLFLFLSLSANDNALPTNLGAGSVPNTPTKATMQQPPATHQRASLFKSIFGIIPIDALRSRPRSRLTDTTQGILTPPSPNLRPTRVPSPISSPRIPSANLPPPPSPNMRRTSIETPRRTSAGYLSPEPISWSQSHPPLEGFVLSSPPRRMSQGVHDAPSPVRRANGSGLRRAVSSNAALHTE